MAHCIGSLTLLMSLALGLEGVRHARRLAGDAAPARGRAQRDARRASTPADALQALGVDTLTTDRDDDPSWADRLYEQALRLYPSGEEECGLPFCRRQMFMFGETYDHDQLNDATHEHLHEAFGVANMTTFKQITLALREGHIVAADGADVYLAGDRQPPAADLVPPRREQPALHARGQPADLRLPRREERAGPLHPHGRPGLRAHGPVHRQGRRPRRLPARSRPSSTASTDPTHRETDLGSTMHRTRPWRTCSATR